MPPVAPYKETTCNVHGIRSDFFIESDRQVIFLPNDLELNPDEGDERYGGKVSATYELIKVEEDRTKVIQRHNSNLR